MDVKKCKLCQCELPATRDFFYTRLDRGVRRLRTSCKRCWGDTQGRKNEARLSRKIWRRNQVLKNTYGITLEDYDRMFSEQEGRCAICRSTSTKYKQYDHSPSFCVDHDHRTGKVRALLCQPCNLTIGFIEKHKMSLQALGKYLEDHDSSRG